EEHRAAVTSCTHKNKGAARGLAAPSSFPRQTPMGLSKSITLFLVLLSAAIGITGCKRSDSTGGPVVSKPSRLDGQQAPRFTLHSDTGGEISSSDFAGKSKMVLVFYRGYW